MDIPVQYFVQYEAVFQLGGFTHRVNIYKNYTEADGPTELVHSFCSTRKNEVLPFAKPYLTSLQIDGVKRLMRDRTDGLFTPEGKFYSN